MSHRAQTLMGQTCGALGFIGLVLGMSRAAAFPTVLGTPGWLLVTASGGALLGVGLIAWGLARRQRPEAGPEVSATQAFSRRMAARADDVLAHQAVRPVPAGVAPGAGEPERVRLDERIRELTRRINRAGVLLATGQLSHEGYARYVEDLKRERGELEASRVQRELAGRS